MVASTIGKWFFLMTLMCFLLDSCEGSTALNRDEKPEDTFRANPIFKQFLNHFSPIPSNAELNTSCLAIDGEGTGNYKKIDIDRYSDFLDGYVGPAVSIGYLSDTSNFYGLVYCTAAACFLPNLSVYTKEGELIQTCLVASGCGTDAGYECNETMRFIHSTKIITTKFEKYYEYDSLNQLIRSSIEESVTKVLYSVDSNGKIKIDTLRRPKMVYE